MDYARDILPLDVDRSDAQIAAILRTVRTKAVPLSELEGKLTLWGLLGRDPATNARTGPLVDAATGDGAVKAVALQLLAWLGSSRSLQISTDSPEVSPVWAAGVAAMRSAGIITEAQMVALWALSGELLFPGVTAEEIADARTEYQNALAAADAADQLQQTRNAYRIRFDAIRNQIGTSEQPQAVTALRTIADELEA